MKIYEKELRTHFEGKSAKEIANTLNISESTLSKLTTKNRQLGIVVAKKLVSIVGIEVANRLIDWEGLPCLQT